MKPCSWGQEISGKVPDKGTGKLGKAGSGPLGRSQAWPGGRRSGGGRVGGVLRTRLGWRKHTHRLFVQDNKVAQHKRRTALTVLTV